MTSKTTPSTGFAFDDRFIEHSLGPGHPECPERLDMIKKVFSEKGLGERVTRVVPLSDPQQYISLVHSHEHIKSVSELPVTGPLAELAVGYGLGAVKGVCEENLKNAFCAVRPPGHHAHNNGGSYDGFGQGEGFCFYNNIAIAARYAKKEFGLKKILIADWDYHHGNGTEWSFYDDPTVLFFSTHCWMTYPGTGDPDRIGSGKGEGYNINVPFNHGAGDDEIIDAFKNKLSPKAELLKPDLILISAGFDSRENDLLGTFRITDDGFSQLTSILMELADKHCDGRLISFMEGGYNVEGNARAAAAHVRTLLG